MDSYTLSICLPLSDRQITAIVVAADLWGVEPWEMAVHALRAKEIIRHGKEGFNAGVQNRP